MNEKEKKYGHVRLDYKVYCAIAQMARENNRKIGAQVAELYKLVTEKK